MGFTDVGLAVADVDFIVADGNFLVVPGNLLVADFTEWLVVVLIEAGLVAAPFTTIDLPCWCDTKLKSS